MAIGELTRDDSITIPKKIKMSFPKAHKRFERLSHKEIKKL